MFGDGVTTTVRLTNRSAVACSGPDFSLPASGWLPTKRTRGFQDGSADAASNSRTMSRFVLPTSVINVPGRQSGLIVRARSAMCATGAQSTTRSAWATADFASAAISVIAPRRRAVSSVAGSRAKAHDRTGQLTTARAPARAIPRSGRRRRWRHNSILSWPGQVPSAAASPKLDDALSPGRQSRNCNRCPRNVKAAGGIRRWQVERPTSIRRPRQAVKLQGRQHTHQIGRIDTC